MHHDALTARLRAAGCVFAEDEAELLLAEDTAPETLEVMVARRVAGEPLEQVLGWVEFLGARYAIDPGVFVPRPRTEFLMELAIGLARPGALVVDLCCGTGALGLALTTAVSEVELHAADLDPRAVACARRNFAIAGIPTSNVHEGDLFTALPQSMRGRIDVLICNTPYVPTDEIALLPPEARDHEPHIALDGGLDGLDIQRRVATEAAVWLAAGGTLLFEASAAQASISAAYASTQGLAAEIVRDDERDATVIVASI